LANADFGSLMKDSFDIFERALYEIGIANVALKKFGVCVQMLRASILTVDLRDKSIEHAHVVPGCDERIDQMRADESGPTSDKDLHC
jgi:hypothetical protein